MTALLSLDGFPLGSGATALALTAASKAETSLALVGDWRPLFAVLAGEQRAPRGALPIAGEDGRSLVLDLKLGLFRANTGWPTSRTVREILELSTRLIGRSPTESRALASEVLQSLGLTSLGKVRLDRLRRIERQIVGLAHALLGGPEILALEDPFGGLDVAERETMAAAISVARSGRKLIASVPNSGVGPWEQSQVQGAEEILVLQEGMLVWQGPPEAFSGKKRLYLMTLQGPLDQVASELGRQGVVVRSMTASGGVDAEATGSGRLLVELPADCSTRVLLEAVHERAAVLLELRSMDNVG